MNTTGTDNTTATATPVIHHSQHMRVVTNVREGRQREHITRVTQLELRWVDGALCIRFSMRELRTTHAADAGRPVRRGSGRLMSRRGSGQ